MTSGKLCLGTVQFGLDYGVSNQNGKVETSEIEKILEIAYRNEIQWLDTACDYGDSEAVLGQIIQNKYNFKISNKTRNFPSDPPAFKEFAKQCEQDIARSCERLHRQSLDIYDFRNLDKIIEHYSEEAITWLRALKSQGTIKKIGASVYTVEEIYTILEHYEVDVIQLPISVLDQRLIEDGTLQKLKDRNIEVHARSVFLQGLIFMSPETMPDFFAPVKDKLRNIHTKLCEQNISPLAASLHFIVDCAFIDKIIVGVTSEKELLEIIEVINTPLPHKMDWEDFKLDEAYYLNPVNWSC